MSKQSAWRGAAILAFQLKNILVDRFYEKFNEIFENSKEIAAQQGGASVLKTFQLKLREIPLWTDDVVTQEYERIMSATQLGEEFNELLRALFYCCVKEILIDSNRSINSNNLNVEIPKSKSFIHRCFIQAARQYFENPHLLENRESVMTPIQINNARRKAKKIIKESIDETVKICLPIPQILKSCPITARETKALNGADIPDLNWLDSSQQDGVNPMMNVNVNDNDNESELLRFLDPDSQASVQQAPPPPPVQQAPAPQPVPQPPPPPPAPIQQPPQNNMNWQNELVQRQREMMGGNQELNAIQQIQHQPPPPPVQQAPPPYQQQIQAQQQMPNPYQQQQQNYVQNYPLNYDFPEGLHRNPFSVIQ